MVAQRRLGKPLGLAALEFVFAAKAGQLSEADARLSRPQKLDLFDADALSKKRLDHARLIEQFEHRGLERGPARLVMGRKPLLDDPRLHPVAAKLARGEKARWTGANDEDLSFGRRALGLCGIHRHSGASPVLPR